MMPFGKPWPPNPKTEHECHLFSINYKYGNHCVFTKKDVEEEDEKKTNLLVMPCCEGRKRERMERTRRAREA
jgi:hypothetical protein